MSRSDDDPLNEIVVERKRVDKRRVVDALDPIVNIDTDGQFVLRDSFSELDSPRKITALALARWAAHETGLSSDPTMDTATLTDHVGISSRTISTYARDKLDFLRETDDGYLIPDERVADAVRYLTEAR